MSNGFDRKVCCFLSVLHPHYIAAFLIRLDQFVKHLNVGYMACAAANRKCYTCWLLDFKTYWTLWFCVITHVGLELFPVLRLSWLAAVDFIVVVIVSEVFYWMVTVTASSLSLCWVSSRLEVTYFITWIVVARELIQHKCQISSFFLSEHILALLEVVIKMICLSFSHIPVLFSSNQIVGFILLASQEEFFSVSFVLKHV